MKTFKEIKPIEIPGNPIHLIGQEWMLITAGVSDHFNTMTASWGGLGELWFKPVCFCFVRPHRYTYEFMEQYEIFTLSFFSDAFKSQLNFCGSRSGRETDKVKECAQLFKEAAFCHIDEKCKEFDLLTEQVSQLEHAADDIKRNIRNRANCRVIFRCSVRVHRSIPADRPDRWRARRHGHCRYQRS